MRIIFFTFLVFIFSCNSPSRVKKRETLKEENKDVVLLARLATDYLRLNKPLPMNIKALLQKDSLNRITNSFETIKMVSKSGHISIYFKFAKTRSLDQMQLSAKEIENCKYLQIKTRKIDGNFDGEIQLDYGERFYRLLKIKVK